MLFGGDRGLASNMWIWPNLVSLSASVSRMEVIPSALHALQESAENHEVLVVDLKNPKFHACANCFGVLSNHKLQLCSLQGASVVLGDRKCLR